MFIKFFTLLFLFSFLISCGSKNKPVSDDAEETKGDGQTQTQTQTTTPTPDDPTQEDPDPKEDQPEELYTITVRGDWPITGSHILDLYFTNMGPTTDVRKHFTRDDLVQNKSYILSSSLLG